MLTKELQIMTQQKRKLKYVENVCWTIIEFVYSSVAAVCVTYRPMHDTAGNEIILVDFRDGAYELAIASIAVVFVLGIILLIVYEMREIDISFGPFLFISVFTVYYMLLIPLAWQICDSQIFMPLLVAASGVYIVEKTRKRFGRPLKRLPDSSCAVVWYTSNPRNGRGKATGSWLMVCFHPVASTPST